MCCDIVFAYEAEDLMSRGLMMCLFGDYNFII